jgi:hypothetical protein
MSNISTDFSTWSTTPASNQPDSGDAATIQSDLQRIQAALRIIFPSVNGAVLPTHTELNFVDGVTSAIQTQLNAKAGLVSPSFTTPILGTPTSGTLTNCTGLPLTTGVTGTLADDNGGTGQSTYTTGDMLFASGANTLAKRAIGTTGQVLTVAGGVPTWANTGIVKTSLSSAYTASSGELLSLAHGLGSVPSSSRLIFQCDTADNGYAVGEKVHVTTWWNGSIAYSNSTFVTSTDCSARAATGYNVALQNKTTGNSFTPTATRWRYYFEVFI